MHDGACGNARTPSRWRSACLHVRLRLLLASSAAFVLASCGSGPGKETKPSPPPSSWGHARQLDDKGLIVEENDIDGDGRVDHRVYSRVKGDPSTRVRAEWDINHDGNIDVWQFFDSHGELAQEGLDLDWDGRIDVIHYFEDGKLARKEVATNFQGQMTIRKHYDAAGSLTMIEQDTDDDGKFDTWEFYEKGKLVRIGRDTNHDGQEDIFTEPTEAYRRKAEEALKQVAQPRTGSPASPAAPGTPAPEPAAAPEPPTAPAPDAPGETPGD